MITQKDLEQLALLKAEMEKSIRPIEQFQQEATEALIGIVFKYYPSLKEIDAEQIYEFGDLVSESTWRLALELEQFTALSGG